MKAYRGALVALIVVGSLFAGISKCCSQVFHEQKVFDANTSMAHPVSIPQEIIRILSKQDKEIAADVKNGFAGRLLEASIVSTSSGRKLYLIIKDTTTDNDDDNPSIKIWLIQNDNIKPAILLEESVDMLEVGARDASGYPAITTLYQKGKPTIRSFFNFISDRYVLRRREELSYYPREQKAFAIQFCKLHNPAPIPLAIHNLIYQDSGIKNMLSYHPPSGEPSTDGWLTASRISRANSRDRLYLIIANGDFAGAHGTTFWLVDNHNGKSKPSIVFERTADFLSFSDADATGYPKINADFIESTMSTEIYRFDAQRGAYRLLQAKGNH